MAFVTADRVSDTTTTTGTGNITVSGIAPTGYRALSTVLSISDTFYYCIQSQTTSEWEAGVGTYASSNVFSRTTILASSNNGNLVVFSAGVKTVFVTFPASKTLQVGPTGALSAPFPFQIDVLTVGGSNSLSVTSFTPAYQTGTSRGLFLLIVNGQTFVPAGASPAFSVSGTTVTWLSTVFGLSSTDSVFAVYNY